MAASALEDDLKRVSSQMQTHTKRQNDTTKQLLKNVLVTHPSRSIVAWRSTNAQNVSRIHIATPQRGLKVAPSLLEWKKSQLPSAVSTHTTPGGSSVAEGALAWCTYGVCLFHVSKDGVKCMIHKEEASRGSEFSGEVLDLLQESPEFKGYLKFKYGPLWRERYFKLKEGTLYGFRRLENAQSAGDSKVLTHSTLRPRTANNANHKPNPIMSIHSG